MREETASLAGSSSERSRGGVTFHGRAEVRGDVVAHDKIVHGDEVRGDKVEGDKKVVEAAEDIAAE